MDGGLRPHIPAKLVCAYLLVPLTTQAATRVSGPSFGLRSLWLAVILGIAALFWLVEKRKQPAVLGELLAGIVLGNLSLVGITLFEPMKTDDVILFLAKFSVCLLLFQIGLESNVNDMRRIGLRAFFAACSGVVVTTILCGFVLGRVVLPASEHAFADYLFLGTVFAATSASISARVLKDLNRLQTREAKIVLGAAVMDDIMSLMLLAIASSVVVAAHSAASIEVTQIAWIGLKALLFLVGSIYFGRIVAPVISSFLARISAEHKMKLLFAFVFFLVYMFGAELSGLDAIIGAFAAGLVLDTVHFRAFRDPALIEQLRAHGLPEEIQEEVKEASERHIEDLIASPAYIFVPIFFVMAGVLVDLRTFSDASVLGLAAALLVAACVGKLACGLAVRKSADMWVVGVAMMARGEVQLIAATMGLRTGVLSKSLFTAVILVVIFTTILVPLLLTRLLRQKPLVRA